MKIPASAARTCRDLARPRKRGVAMLVFTRLFAGFPVRMIPANDDGRALSLKPQEWLFLAAVMFTWAVFVVALGKDTSWDFRNYHWYIPYAFLNGRMTVDVAVAHMATYYNPLVDVPFYWLAVHAPAWFALGAMGAVQGANVIPLYIIARQSLSFSENR